MDLTQQIIETVDRYWSDDVEIIDAWPEGPDIACVVHRRKIDPALILGHRAVFQENAADGTVQGYARDIAVNLAEPIGVLAATSRQDQYGIVWIVVPEGQATPQPPAEVIRRLEELNDAR